MRDLHHEVTFIQNAKIDGTGSCLTFNAIGLSSLLQPCSLRRTSFAAIAVVITSCTFLILSLHFVTALALVTSLRDCKEEGEVGE